MYRLWNALPLLADRDPRLDGIASGFRQRQATAGSGTMVVLLVVFGGLIIAFWLIARYTDRRERQGPKSRPWRLFFGLAKAHRLKLSQIWFLWRLARRHQLADPAMIFLEPERLEPAQLGTWGSARADLLGAVSRRLFGQLTDGASPQEEATRAGESHDAGMATTEEASIPLFPTFPRPQLDLSSWSQASGEAPTAIE